jgi:hypothetical protein
MKNTPFLPEIVQIGAFTEENSPQPYLSPYLTLVGAKLALGITGVLKAFEAKNLIMQVAYIDRGRSPRYWATFIYGTAGPTINTKGGHLRILKLTLRALGGPC